MGGFKALVLALCEPALCAGVSGCATARLGSANDPYEQTSRDMLQGELSRAGKSMWRLVINSTLGLGGFFDPASKIGITGHGEDLRPDPDGVGCDEGPYLALPFIGPSNPCDATGRAVNTAIDPQPDRLQATYLVVGRAREYFILLDLKGQTYQTIQGIQRSSVDFYSSLRSLYRQMRNDEIRNCRVQSEDLPDF
jgi:phospholipid-binding lipoprotein MlaA